MRRRDGCLYGTTPRTHTRRTPFSVSVCRQSETHGPSNCRGTAGFTVATSPIVTAGNLIHRQGCVGSSSSVHLSHCFFGCLGSLTVSAPIHFTMSLLISPKKPAGSCIGVEFHQCLIIFSIQILHIILC
ncbi:hypothetical protein mRhiFer1_009497 [Rhinolophus ferrumequinum]|uniref:Uncharacterized protein n=1 Tax=Rhinolophus ferrumequinum TaxID=59479 RepID=A0A7J7REU9_RHIFE|nr:hypothetical protein mRhiFer1_009497 [Rhinolophus ferrumequinum]